MIFWNGVTYWRGMIIRLLARSVLFRNSAFQEMDVSISAPLDFSLPIRGAIRSSDSGHDRPNPALLELLHINTDARRARDVEINSAFRIVTPKIKIQGKLSHTTICDSAQKKVLFIGQINFLNTIYEVNT